MTDSSKMTFTPTDFRRASALLTHCAAGDLAGMSEIWAECARANAVTDLAAALVTLFLDLSPELKTETGLVALRELTRSWAAAEAEVDA
jgi:hypothetical protein